MENFIEGDVYFRITYPDVDLKFPQIESFVFIGKNLSYENDDSAWYFQHSRDYAKFGSILTSDEGDRQVRILQDNELNEMLNVKELMIHLKEAAQRRRN